MSNSVLRRKLSKALKEAGMGKLYTCPKRQSYKWLRAHNMRNMINFLKIKPGMVVFEYGVNQRVKKAPDFVLYDSSFKTISRGYVWHKADQVEYESGYLSCGCGSFACFSSEDALRPRTKTEIVANFSKEIKGSQYPSWLAKLYFKSLKYGLDIIDNDGFLIPTYKKFIHEVDPIDQ